MGASGLFTSLLCLFAVPALSDLIKHQEPPNTTTTTSAPAPTGTVLECIQVAPPVLTPEGASGRLSTVSDGSEVANEIAGSGSAEDSCTVLLMEHVFGFSYGMPFVGNYTPPSCAFNRVTMNFTAVSAGRQFDRLALMYFGDTEVWRTSTAEPTPAPGIHWTYLKDMTEYLYFWRSPQTLIFDLGNLLDDKYTGPFNTTLTATFFMDDSEPDGASPADVIIPISARKSSSNEVSQFTLPADNATNTISFPQNVNRAVFSISANGQASEEFWWSNVLQSDVYAFNQTAGQLPGLSPFREVQLLIDGQIAGVQWPFPVIFTGGVVPSLHRPIVGLQAFDLKEHQVDITPWLPLLCDGTEHTFTIRVAGMTDDGSSSVSLTETVNDSWYVTGKIFVWLDEEGSVTTGSTPAIEFNGPNITFSRALAQNATGFNETLTFSTAVQRTISVRASIRSQNRDGEAAWSQTLSYTNDATVAAYGFNQLNNFSIAGTDVATAPDVAYRATYDYPLLCNQTYSVSPQGNLTIHAHLVEGLQLQVEGDSVFPTGLAAFGDAARFAGSYLSTSRDGTASFFQTGDGRNSSGFGSTNQIFYFGGIGEGGEEQQQQQLYSRNVTAVNGTITFNSEERAGDDVASVSDAPAPSAEGAQSLFAAAKIGPGAFEARLGAGVGSSNAPTGRRETALLMQAP